MKFAEYIKVLKKAVLKKGNSGAYLKSETKPGVVRRENIPNPRRTVDFKS